MSQRLVYLYRLHDTLPRDRVQIAYGNRSLLVLSDKGIPLTDQSCMTEAQKYEGALYKGEKKQGKNQNQRKGKNDANDKQITNGNHRAPYIEDAPDTGNMAPPPAPTPPPAGAAKPSTTGKPVNVFDYLVTDQTPNASKVSLKEQMQMRDHAPSVFEPSKALAHLGDTEGEDEDRQYDVAFEENGFSYGADPIPPSMYQGRIPNVSTEFMTPAPKKKKERSRVEKKVSPETGRTPGTVSDKKRKRGPTEDHDMNDAEDTPMTDAPSSVLNNPGTPMLNHSGLTGGLSRMLRSPSVEGEEQAAADDRRRSKGTGQVPSSPLKRTRRSNDKDATAANADAGLGISLKNRAGRIVSSMFGGSAVSGSSGSSNEPPSKALIRTRRRSSSDEGGGMEIRRSKKTHHVRNSTTGAIVSTDPSSRQNKHRNGHADDRPSRRVKQIEYPTRSRSHSRSRSRSPRNDEVVVYRGGDHEPSHSHGHTPSELEQEMAAHFLSLVTKGPDSSRGLSMNKTLKRFHRDFSDEYEYGYEEERGRGRGRSRADRERRMDDEKDLWRTLRLRRNERGEVVVFF